MKVKEVKQVVKCGRLAHGLFGYYYIPVWAYDSAQACDIIKANSVYGAVNKITEYLQKNGLPVLNVEFYEDEEGNNTAASIDLVEGYIWVWATLERYKGRKLYYKADGTRVAGQMPRLYMAPHATYYTEDGTRVDGRTLRGYKDEEADF